MGRVVVKETDIRDNLFVFYKKPLLLVLSLILLGGVFAYTKLQTSLFPEIGEGAGC
jgi:hypothetical protein